MLSCCFFHTPSEYPRYEWELGTQCLPKILDAQQFWTTNFCQEGVFALLLAFFAEIFYLSYLEWSFCYKKLSEIFFNPIFEKIIGRECQIRRFANPRAHDVYWIVIYLRYVKMLYKWLVKKVSSLFFCKTFRNNSKQLCEVWDRMQLRGHDGYCIQGVALRQRLAKKFFVHSCKKEMTHHRRCMASIMCLWRDGSWAGGGRRNCSLLPWYRHNPQYFVALNWLKRLQ